METYIGDSLAAGFIHPSSSPASAGFFMEKKDKTLCPYIDYRGLRQVLEHLLKNQLFVKSEKCEFHHSTILILGYIISAGSVQMDPSTMAFPLSAFTSHKVPITWSPAADRAVLDLKHRFTTSSHPGSSWFILTLLVSSWWRPMRRL